MRIAVFDNAWEGWPTLAEYAKAQVWSALLALGGDSTSDVVAVSEHPDTFIPPPSLSARRLQVVRGPEVRGLQPVERVLRKMLGGAGFWKDPRMRDWEAWIRARGVDALVSFCPPEWWQPCRAAVCAWIPDFQHLHLSGYFSEEERAARSAEFARFAAQADIVLTSSESVKDDFVRFSPRHAHKARVFRFPSLFSFVERLAAPDVAPALDRYGIERQFMLVVNQFFAHKNHMRVLEAMGMLHREGRCPQVVMIGSTIDHRDRATRTMSGILARVAELHLEGRAKILGFVPADVRDALLRCCKALIQPSEFEGWNTSIEDAKALGRPIMASDLPAHREQIDQPFGLFSPDDAHALASLIAKADRDLPPGPDPRKEAESLVKARAAALASGEALWAACRDAVAARRQGGPWGDTGRPETTREGASASRE